VGAPEPQRQSNSPKPAEPPPHSFVASRPAPLHFQTITPVRLMWCREGDLNPHNPFGSADFKSAASASFAIPACSQGNDLLPAYLAAQLSLAVSFGRLVRRGWALASSQCNPPAQTPFSDICIRAARLMPAAPADSLFGGAWVGSIDRFASLPIPRKLSIHIKQHTRGDALNGTLAHSWPVIPANH
jgi:hypothetical protein